MKQLLLIRHGKSEWGNSQLQDFDRPLNHRGQQDAPEMASRILQRQWLPDLILSSPALRAITTARLFEQVWQKPEAEIIQNPAIYEADKMALLSVVNKLSNDYGRIALFGHNPGLTDFANYLGSANIYNVPTCGVVSLEFPANEWSEIGVETGVLIEFDYPKSLDGD